jgi:translation initiation factor IF-3
MRPPLLFLYVCRSGRSITEPSSISRTALTKLPRHVSLGPARQFSQCSLRLLPSKSQTSAQPAKLQFPRNEAIKPFLVRFVDPATGRLSDPEPLSKFLLGIDRSLHDLVEVSPGIVKLLPSLNTRGRSSKAGTAGAGNKDQEKEKKKSALVNKTIELNYAIDAHDLQHRLQKLREFLEKGYRVEVVLARKRRTRLTTIEERQKVLESVRAVLGEVKGGIEWKKEDGVLEKGSKRLFFQGKLPATPSTSAVKDTEQLES